MWFLYLDAAQAQKHVREKDTVVKKKDLNKISVINRNRNKKGDEEVNNKNN